MLFIGMIAAALLIMIGFIAGLILILLFLQILVGQLLVISVQYSLLYGIANSGLV